MIGIFGILERLFTDNIEYIEEFALDHGLLDELYFSCLFQEHVEAPNIDVTSSFDPNSSKYDYH